MRALVSLLLLAVALLAASSPPAPAEGPPLLAGGELAQHGFARTLPFSMVRNSILVDLRLGSDPAAHRFLLDTGAPFNLSPRLAAGLALRETHSAELAGPEGGRKSVPVARLPRVEVGGAVFRDVGVVLDWVDPPDPLACLSRAGLLGASLLHLAIWQIDFEARRITVTDDPDRLSSLDPATRIPFSSVDPAGSPRIDARINGNTTASFLLDLGFNGALAMPRKLYEQSGGVLTNDMPSARGSTSATVLEAAAQGTRIGQIRDLGIGTLEFAELPVLTGDGVSDFHLGVDFLRHFQVTIDWRNGDLYLAPKHGTGAVAPRFESYGFSAELREGRLVVGSLWQASPVARAGLQLGDRILAIDDRDLRAPSFAEYCRVLDRIDLYGTSDAEIEVEVERPDGVVRLRAARTSLLE